MTKIKIRCDAVSLEFFDGSSIYVDIHDVPAILEQVEGEAIEYIGEMDNEFIDDLRYCVPEQILR